jgi:c(7)-type cytochrome triheme protein
MFLMAVTAEALTLRAYNGDVIFDHAAHKKMFACKDCHEGGPRHMGLDKASAHKLCLGCHTAQKAGPVKHCSDCHKKA